MTAMGPLFTRKFTREFLTLFRKNKCLWCMHSTDYRDKRKRAAAYKELLKKYRQINPTATVSEVRTKLDAYRASYRRELRRALAAEAAGEEHTIRLWYFNLLTFLHRQHMEESAEEEDEDDIDIAYQSDGSCGNIDVAPTSSTDHPEERSDSTRNLQRKFITELVHLYRDKPCLWNEASEDFRNKKMRSRAFAVLLQKYRQVDPTADLKLVRNKIDGLRATYRREMNKVRQSVHSGSGDWYIPSLWYFPLLTFLNKDDLPELPQIVAAIGRKDTDEDSLVRSWEFGADDDLGDSQPLMDQSDSEHGSRSQMYVSSSGDVYDLVGQSVAYKLRNLKTLQRIHAEKLISEVLYHAELGYLDRHTALLVTDPDDKLL